MGAVAETTSLRVVAALKRVELAVSSAETRSGGERRKIRAGCLLHRGGQSAFAERVREQPGARFQIGEVIGCVADSFPSIFEASCIEIADDRLALTWRRGPSNPVRGAVGK